jgi:hypothetical protein
MFMGGRKIWFLFVVFVLLGVVYSVTPTSIIQEAFPASPQIVNLTYINNPMVVSVFTADYNYTYNGVSQSVPNASVVLYVDGVPHIASFLQSPPVGAYHYFAIVNLTAGNHTWYFSAGSPLTVLGGFASAAASPQTYTVNPYPTFMVQMSDKPSPQNVNSTTNLTTVVFTANYNFTYTLGSQQYSVAVPNSTVVLYVDGVPHIASFLQSPPNGLYQFFVIVNMKAGTHTWYFTAGSSSSVFAPSSASLQTFVVLPLPSSAPSTYPTYMVQNAISVTPPYTSISSAVVNISTDTAPVGFTADYNLTYQGMNYSIPGANVVLYVDGVPYPTESLLGSSSPPAGIMTFVSQIINLPLGTHTWYFAAGALDYSHLTPIFQPQTGPTQTFVVTCPAPYCSGNNLCTYSGSNCTVTCSYCPSGLCSGGGCRGGGGSPLLVKTPISGEAEQVAAQPTSNTWDFAVVVLTIIGLCIGYFIMKEALSASVTRPAKKRKGR